jgi:hypothetical protein
MLPESGFHLATLRGNPGIVSTFVRGKGQWCALREPTRVLQVYYFEGIPNHNGLLGRAEFAPGVWHHACLVIARGQTVRWTINGVEIGNHTIRGRPFRQNDGGTLEIGPNWLAHPLSVDEILVLDVALESSEVTAYADAVRKLAAVGWPSDPLPRAEAPTPAPSQADRE